MQPSWTENPPHGSDEPLISVVLPCFDEVESVGECVAEALAAMAGAGLVGEVVVVDNGSTDGSDEVAVAAGARLVSELRAGYGNALAAGIEASRGRIVVMADADSTYDLSRIPDLVAPIVDGTADLVLGSRLATATRETMPLAHRLVGTPAITFLIARASGGRLLAKDSQSGFRAFRRDDFARLGLQSSGMEFASEMLIRAGHAGWRVHEVPTRYRPRVGKSKLNTLSDGWRHLLLILSLAPDLLLVGPGAALMVLGVALSILSLLSPGGISLGSLQWQPVFFSTIALVLGTQAFLAGSVLAYRLSVISGGTRFAFAGDDRFSYRCVVAGATLGGRRPRHRPGAVRGVGHRTAGPVPQPGPRRPGPEPAHRGGLAGHVRPGQHGPAGTAPAFPNQGEPDADPGPAPGGPGRRSGGAGGRARLAVTPAR